MRKIALDAAFRTGFIHEARQRGSNMLLGLLERLGVPLLKAVSPSEPKTKDNVDWWLAWREGRDLCIRLIGGKMVNTVDDVCEAAKKVKTDSDAKELMTILLADSIEHSNAVNFPAYCRWMLHNACEIFIGEKQLHLNVIEHTMCTDIARLMGR